VSKKEAKKAPKGEEAEAPEVAEGEEGEGAPGKKKLPLKMIIIAGLKPKPEAAAEGEHGKGAHGKEEKGKKKEKGGHGKEKEGEKKEGGPVITEGPDGIKFVTIPNVVVNMQTADGRPTFLKLKLTFEIHDEEAVELLEPNMPRLQDMFQTFLRELRPEDLQGSQGSYQLRTEIQRRVNLVIAPSKVNAVLIEEMLIN
jgi:flagellar protein FliL